MDTTHTQGQDPTLIERVAFGSSGNGLTEKKVKGTRDKEERRERGRDLTERGSGEFAMEGRGKRGNFIGLSQRTSPLGAFVHGNTN